jgi:hypothetical protein
VGQAWKGQGSRPVVRQPTSCAGLDAATLACLQWVAVSGLVALVGVGHCQQEQLVLPRIRPS